MSSSRYPDLGSPLTLGEHVTLIAKIKDVDETAEPAASPEPTASPARARRALRRLQSGPPPPFEQVIDMMYEWWEHESLDATSMMRKLLSTNHNVSDLGAVAEIRGFVRTARMNRISIKVAALGLDEAERILGLNEDEA